MFKIKKEMVLERTYKSLSLPLVGDKMFNGEKMFVQSVGVKLKKIPFEDTYFLSVDKKSFVAKNNKGEWINAKIM